MSLPYKPDSSVAAISGFSSYLEQGTKIIKVQVSLGAQMENTLHCCLNKCCCFFYCEGFNLFFFSHSLQSLLEKSLTGISGSI